MSRHRVGKSHLHAGGVVLDGVIYCVANVCKFDDPADSTLHFLAGESPQRPNKIDVFVTA